MTLWAKFNTHLDAVTRLGAENEARGETYFSQISDHDSDGSSLLAVDDTFSMNERSPFAVEFITENENVAPSGYQYPVDLSQLAYMQAQKREALIEATHAYEQIFFSGPAHSLINSLNDLGYACSIHENDGSHLSAKALKNVIWIGQLWGLYDMRKAEIESATTIDAVNAVSLDMSIVGPPPHFIAEIQDEYNALLYTITAGLPNVPQEIKDLFGL